MRSLKTLFIAASLFLGLSFNIKAQKIDQGKEINSLDAFGERIREKNLPLYSDSITLITKAIKLHPNDILMYLQRAQYFEKIMDKTSAIDDYNKMIALEPEDYFAYYLKAQCLLYLKDYRQAILNYTLSLERRESPDVYADRGDVKQLLEDFRGAYYDYTKAIDMYLMATEYPLKKYVLPHAYYSRGYILVYELNSKDAGCLDLSKAGELGSILAYDIIKSACK